ncbi:MAG: tetratricopeptide repeat protein, partial [Acidobacteriota bacterium]
AMLIVMLAPLMLTYYLVFKPALKKQQPVVNSIAYITGPTRYEKLDQQIDLYLASLPIGNRDAADAAMAAATEIAKDMEINTGDLVGKDIVKYYRALPVSLAATLRDARQLRSEVERSVSMDQYALLLEKAERAKRVFQRLVAHFEIARTDIQIAKYLIKCGRFIDARTIINDALPRTLAANYLYTHAQLLAWQGNYLCEIAEFRGARRALEAAIAIAQDLDVPEFLLGPYMVLAAQYSITNENLAAFELARKALNIARPVNHKYTVQLLHIAGISAFNLNKPASAEAYLQESVILAEQNNNHPQLAMSHTFWGIVQMEQDREIKAEEHFLSALNSMQKIIDVTAKINLEAVVTGYYARSKALAGDHNKAVELYTHSLVLAEKANIKQSLMLSQLHQGLGESLAAKGNHKKAQSELELAVAFNTRACANTEGNNTLLTFATTRKSSAEQLRLLPR